MPPSPSDDDRRRSDPHATKGRMVKRKAAGRSTPRAATRRETTAKKPVDCYDYPQYWDLAFRSETRLEADFIEAVARAPKGAVKAVFPVHLNGHCVDMPALRAAAESSLHAV